MWGYYSAAALHGYTITHNKETKTWSLRGTVVASDIYRLRQRPLFMATPHKSGGFGAMFPQRWEIVSHQISNGTVRATLSPLPGERAKS